MGQSEDDYSIIRRPGGRKRHIQILCDLLFRRDIHRNRLCRGRSLQECRHGRHGDEGAVLYLHKPDRDDGRRMDGCSDFPYFRLCLAEAEVLLFKWRRHLRRAVLYIGTGRRHHGINPGVCAVSLGEQLHLSGCLAGIYCSILRRHREQRELRVRIQRQYMVLRYPKLVQRALRMAEDQDYGLGWLRNIYGSGIRQDHHRVTAAGMFPLRVLKSEDIRHQLKEAGIPVYSGHRQINRIQRDDGAQYGHRRVLYL